MKTLLFSFLLLVLGTGAVQAQNQSDNALIGRARGALGACVGQAQQAAPTPIQSRVDVISACFATGFIKRVTFYYHLRPHLQSCHRPGLRPGAALVPGGRDGRF